MQEKELPRILLSVKDGAAMLSISQRTLWELSKRGEIAVCRIGTRVLFPVKELERFIAEHSAVEPQA
ncbi:hypothetical protein FACS189443_7230 [Planctomycetales bacterium]|nr:hypothetical protein FACS189443_7230 [Planctomycetales bacterium]